jgi:hypothetical protein
MYANVNLISHTKLVCENVVFSEPCCLENKCGVGKAFLVHLQSNRAIWLFGKLGKCFPKMFLVWHCFEKIRLWTHWIEDSNTKLLQVVSLQIIFRNQMVIKIVIWLNLKVASVCTFEIWKLLVPECSICSEESRDYKFVENGCTEHFLWIIWCR